MTTEQTVTASKRGLVSPERSAYPNPNAVLAVVAVAELMVILDATILNVALPTIRSDLGFSEQSLSWVLNAYALMFGASYCAAAGWPTGWVDVGCSWPGSHCSPARR